MKLILEIEFVIELMSSSLRTLTKTFLNLTLTMSKTLALLKKVKVCGTKASLLNFSKREESCQSLIE